MDEGEECGCASCGVVLSHREGHDVEEAADDRLTVRDVLALNAGKTPEQLRPKTCDRCFELVRRLQRAETVWRDLKKQLVAACAGQTPKPSLALLADSKQTQTETAELLDETQIKTQPVISEVKMEFLETQEDDYSAPPSPISPVHYSDSDDEPLYKTKLNALLRVETEIHLTEDLTDEYQPVATREEGFRTTTFPIRPFSEDRYSCRECSFTFPDKSLAAVHVFSKHRIDPAKDPQVIVDKSMLFGNSTNVDSKKIKGKRKSHKRNVANKRDKSPKNKSKLLKHLQLPIPIKEMDKSDLVKPLKTVSELQKKLGVRNLTIKKVPYESQFPLMGICSLNDSKKDKLIISGVSNSNTVLNQLQTAGLRVSSKMDEKKLKKDKKILPCPECTAVFHSKARLDIHILKHESTKGPYICEVCGASYKHKKACDIHVAMHKGISPWKCGDCGKIFPSKGALARHEAIHTGTPNYQCDLCGKSFIHTSSFKMHKLSHSGVKPHTCSKCGLALMTRSHLKRHQRVHSGEKRHECETCGKKFSERYNLYAHQKSHHYSSVHRPGKNLNCTLCDSTFIRRHLLEKHMASVHQLIPESKAKQPRNTMNRLLKQQTETNSFDTSQVKPEVTLTEIIIERETPTPPPPPPSSSQQPVKGEPPYSSEIEIRLNNQAPQNPGPSIMWQGINYHLANDYPLRMHGVDFVGYLNNNEK